MYIKPYIHDSFENHHERRARKLLLQKHDIRAIVQSINKQGYTLAPLKLYFKKGYAKILVGIAKGKQKHDKREDIKARDQKR